MRELVRFFLIITIMIVTTSCMTGLYYRSYDPIYGEVPSGEFNPMNYEVLYSPSWGYYYYDNYRARFLFDDYICMHYPHLRAGRYEHWDFGQYHSNNYVTKLNSGNTNQRNGQQRSNTAQRSSNSNYQSSGGSRQSYSPRSRVQTQNSNRNYNSRVQSSRPAQQSQPAQRNGSYSPTYRRR